MHAFRVTLTPTFYGKPVTIDVTAPTAPEAKERVEWFASHVHSVEQSSSE